MIEGGLLCLCVDSGGLEGGLDRGGGGSEVATGAGAKTASALCLGEALGGGAWLVCLLRRVFELRVAVRVVLIPYFLFLCRGVMVGGGGRGGGVGLGPGVLGSPCYYRRCFAPMVF